jgi:hypothetical protein
MRFMLVFALANITLTSVVLYLLGRFFSAQRVRRAGRPDGRCGVCGYPTVLEPLESRPSTRKACAMCGAFTLNVSGDGARPLCADHGGMSPDAAGAGRYAVS